MFRTILIANRGEIACRIARSAKALGARVVAVHSDVDVGAAHVAAADLAVNIGGARPAESYLRGDRIIQAALETGAEAIHPGYGFLSENPEFVEAVEAAGLVFIGPSAAAIRAMGLKDAAKALMEAAGVPVVPGYHGAEQAPEYLAAQAGEIGYPVLIKAVAGGGGKGMRLVERAGDFAAALESAQGEARTAFGNPAVLIEKYIEQPRHIEVQVFGDGLRAVHLFERDCSLQRRHQKVIEEAPAPGMPEAVRLAMGQAAVKAAEAIGYKGAGTIEFIVDGSNGLRADGFWFMEMNTRLQVEHPVTEAITGVDLVQWQLRVAAGEDLPLRQEELSIRGHAFEARLYAEDVAAGFLPATGQLAHLAFPNGVRADTGVRSGDVISPWYDPMIAKVIVHGPTRDLALSALAKALEETQVAGTVTNLGFLARLARHDGFRRGEVDTGLIGRDLAQLVPEGAEDLASDALAAMILGAFGCEGEAGFALWAPLVRRVELIAGERAICAFVSLDALGAEVQLGAERVRVARGPTGWHMAGRIAVESPGAVHVFDGTGACRSYAMADLLARNVSGGAAAGVTLSPMPGLVKAVFVAAGEPVVEGARLAVLEAMKMEHTLVAARDGVVAEVLVDAGMQVEAGAALIRLEQ